MKKTFFVLLMAAMMFTSTWAGVFAADTTADNAAGTEAADTAGSVNAQEDEFSITAKVKEKLAESWTAELTWTAWDAEEGQDVVYDLYVYEKTEERGAAVATGLTELTYEETGLELDTEYVAEVVARSEETELGNDSCPMNCSASGLEPVTGVEFLSGYNTVKVMWEKVEGATSYIVETSNGKVIETEADDYDHFDTEKGKYFFIHGSKDSLDDEVAYTYTIYAVNGTEKSEPVVKKFRGCVRPLYINLKLKKKRTLTAIDGSRKKITLSAGTTLHTQGYVCACYKFQRKVGGKMHSFRVARTSTTGQKALYVKKGKWDYTREEADFFVNRYMTKRNLKSKTNYVIWVSYYTQRMYIMKKADGQWTCVKDWDCSTGKGSTPSPTGNKALNDFKKSSHHGIPWWNGYSGHNSIHGKRPAYVLGEPHSHGCIRNLNKNAKFVYKTVNTKIGTRVICF